MVTMSGLLVLASARQNTVALASPVRCKVGMPGGVWSKASNNELPNLIYWSLVFDDRNWKGHEGPLKRETSVHNLLFFCSLVLNGNWEKWFRH